MGKWIKELADKRGDASYEIVDLADYNLPFLGDPSGEQQVAVWAKKIASLDGFVFVTAEYNHSITGVLKNVLDSSRAEWYNKAAGIVSYGRYVESGHSLVYRTKVCSKLTRTKFVTNELRRSSGRKQR